MEPILAFLCAWTFLVGNSQSSSSLGGVGKIAGCVTTQSGSPISEAAVAIVKGTAPFPDIAALTDDQGKYQLSDIPAGTFEVAVYSEGYAAHKRTVTIKEGKTSILDFILVHPQ